MGALLGLDATEISRELGAGLPAFRSRQIYDALYRQRAASWAEITTLPQALRDELDRRLPIGWPDVAAEYSSTDGTRRYLLRLADGRTVETVFMPRNRATPSAFRPRWVVPSTVSSASRP